MNRSVILIFLVVSFPFAMQSQDEIVTKEYQYDPDPDLRITRIYTDTIYYRSFNRMEKIVTEDDELRREIKAKTNFTTSDSTQLVIRADMRHEWRYVYLFI